MLEKKIGMKAVPSIFLIALTLLMPVTFTLLQPEIDLVRGKIKQNSMIDSFALVLSKVIEFFDIMPSASAQEPLDIGCCEKMKNTGALCQDGVYEVQCEPGKWHKDVLCKEVCLGCCIDTKIGSCNANSVQARCQGANANFIMGDVNCEQIPACKKGCCIFGSSVDWTTENECKNLYGGKWDTTVGEEECKIKGLEQERGCCVYNCIYETLEECANQVGLTPSEILQRQFFTYQKCYDNVKGCERCSETHLGCIEGFPERMYKKDSCGNNYTEEVGDACPVGTWCNFIEDKCVDATCYDVYTSPNDPQRWETSTTWTVGRSDKTESSINKINGEAWCVYDTPLDMMPGGAPVGSTHFRRWCLYGKEYGESCGEGRTRICEEAKCINTSASATAETCVIINNKDDCINTGCTWLEPTQAFCMVNLWGECFNITNKDECERHPQCFWWTEFAEQHEKLLNDESLKNKLERVDNKNWLVFVKDRVEAGSKRKEGDMPVCLPKVPLGTTNSENFPSQDAICSLGTGVFQYSEEWAGLMTENKEVRESEWRTFMAHGCKSLGDCGTWINWIGKNTTGYRILEVDSIENPNLDRPKKTIALPQSYLDFRQEANVLITQGTLEVGGFFLLFLPSVGLGWLLGLTPLWRGLVGTIHIDVASDLALKFGFTAAGVAAFLVGVVLWYIALKQPVGSPERGALEAAGTGFMTYGVLHVLHVAAAGPIAAGVGVALFIAYLLTSSIEFYYHECGPSLPEVGSVDCDKCNEDPERPCSKYRCKALGQACEFKDKITIGNKEFNLADGQCIGLANDGLSPKIETVNIKNAITGENYITDFSVNQYPPYTISIPNNIPEFSKLSIKLKLDENAICMYDYQSRLSFEEMLEVSQQFGSGTPQKNQEAQVFVFYDKPAIYLRCIDVHGNANIADYVFSFSGISGVDDDAPYILGIDPADGWKFANNLEKVTITIYTHDATQPVNCTFSRLDASKSYDMMKAETGAECQSTEFRGSYGCEFKDVSLTKDVVNQFHFRCKDAVTTPGSNIMQQSKSVSYFPAPPLFITSIIPENGAYVKGCEISGVELEVETSGGAEDGKATCYWKNQSIDFIRFTETNAVSHKTNVSATSQTINITCYDSALNSATNLTSFIVEADQTPPVITRIYKDSGNLVLRTNEKATCTYHYSAGRKINNCDFAANDTLRAKLFESTDGTEHSTAWDDEPWYVKCYDACGNGWTGPCIVIHPSDFE